MNKNVQQMPYVAHKVWNIYYLAFYQKRVLTSAINSNNGGKYCFEFIVCILVGSNNTHLGWWRVEDSGEASFPKAEIQTPSKRLWLLATWETRSCWWHRNFQESTSQSWAVQGACRLSRPALSVGRMQPRIQLKLLKKQLAGEETKAPGCCLDWSVRTPELLH